MTLSIDLLSMTLSLSSIDENFSLLSSLYDTVTVTSQQSHHTHTIVHHRPTTVRHSGTQNTTQVTRMAAAALGERVYCSFSDTNTLKQTDYNVNEEKLRNGKLDNHKNGHIKTEHLTNGVTHKYEGAHVVGASGDGAGAGCSVRGDAYPGSFEKCSLMTSVLTNVGLYILMFLGFINQLLFTPRVATEANREGYAALYDPFEQFYSRYVYRRVRHCFNRPIVSAPGAELVLKERETHDYNWSFRFTGVERRCINLGSYNYLGFAEGAGSVTAAAVRDAVRRYGLALCSPRAELGTTPLHHDLERTLADFLGVEAAMVVGMGFATNVLSLPGLLGPGVLALSDENNHASLILGLRMSRATVRVFRHNDVRHAEQLATAAIAENKWRKIVIVVEGVYSMEGSICPLRALVALRRRLGLQLYLDEAHSIGALGPSGRGVTDYSAVDPSEVDVLMGTFTKSFGAAGGYIAGSRRLVACVRGSGHAHAYAHSMAPPVAAQVLAATRAIASPPGQARVRALRDNTHYFRQRLRAMGVVTFGHEDSPVVPMLVYTFSKMAATVERLTARGVASVGVGFPATPLSMARIRFCLSASHSRAQLEHCLRAIEQVVDEVGLRYSRRTRTCAA